MPTFRLAATWLALIVVWSFQYTIAVPAIYVWRAARWLLAGATKVGVLGVLLLFLPIVGWLILAWLHHERRADRRAGLVPEPTVHPNPLRPWLIGAVR